MIENELDFQREIELKTERVIENKKSTTEEERAKERKREREGRVLPML